MATVLNTMYPPQVGTFMPSFRYNEPATIWFDISSYDEDMLNKIKFIHVSMINQKNSRNVFAGLDNNNNIVRPQYYPVIFNSNTMWDSNEKKYKLEIPPQVLNNSHYNIDEYYKIQLRFDLTGGSINFQPYSEDYSDPTTFFYWNDESNNTDAFGLALYTNYNENNFSEWSTGTLIKPISIPELSIQNFSQDLTKQVVPSTDIKIAGSIIFSYADETEQLAWYQIKILGSNNISTNKIYTGTQINPNKIYCNVDLSSLEPSDTNIYQMQIIYETINGYSETVEYPIQIIQYINDTSVLCEPVVDEENGRIVLNISNINYKSGYLIIRRSSYQSHFSYWNLIAAYDISSLSNNKLEIVDNTVESITGYRYQLQYIRKDRDSEIPYRPQYVYTENNNIIHCDFYGGLFSDKDRKLKISFDFQLSNRANAANRSKIDTLGSQYPIFVQNSKLKYHTYNISGRISSEDGGEFFLPKDEIFDEEYYNYRYNDNNNTVDTSYLGGSSGSSTPIKKIQPNNDWLYEREYRDAVEEWLNNGKPKLFRSMTEGNMIVMLDNISMTPDTVLGRRLYTFNATMYEIGNGKDLDSIVSFGLFDRIDQR